MGSGHCGREFTSHWSRYRNPMLMRVCYDVISGLTTADWSLTRVNELLVLHKRALGTGH